MISYKDIAEKAGVSEMTVSRVLRGNLHVRDSTRDRVLEAAGELGYQRNPLVDMLMKQVRAKRVLADVDKIAWLLPSPQSKADGVFSFYRQGAEEKARDLGFHIDEFHLTERLNAKRIREILKTRGIHGILVNPAPEHDFHLDFDFSGFAAVTFGYSVEAPALNRVTSHHTHNQYELLSKLREMGFRRIMHVTPLWQEKRLNFGWLAPTLAFGMYHAEDMEVSYMDFAEFRDRIDQDPDRGWLPEVVVSNHIHMLDYLKAKGFSVPEDISFATTTCEGPEGHEKGGVRISGMDQCSTVIGRRAMEFLADQMALNRFGVPETPSALLVEGSWRDGDTLLLPK